jgi:hypothetical protein
MLGDVIQARHEKSVEKKAGGLSGLNVDVQQLFLSESTFRSIRDT